MLVALLSCAAFAGIAQAAGPATNISLALSPNAIVADGTSTTTATATVTDAQGLRVPGEPVHFSGETGQRVGTTTDNGDGTYTATITSSRTVGMATITATDGSAPRGHATLTQTPGPPASIAVHVSPGDIVADGTSIATATATVTDNEGHGVPNDTIVFSSSDPGQFFGPVTTPAGGVYTVQFRSSTKVGIATITATDQHHLSGHATLRQSSGKVHVAGVVTSTMQWVFSFTGRYTKVRALSVRGASPPISMLVACHGGGCPFAKRTVTAAKAKRCSRTGKSKCAASGNVNLASSFKKPLRVGATITVRISRQAWIGKYYKFVIRARRPPRIQIDCLAPGGTRPGVGCST